MKIENGTATIDYGSEKRMASALNGEFSPGDYVIVVGRVVIQRIPEEQAIAALKFYNEAVTKG